MNRITGETLKMLTEKSPDLAISIYMPTYRAGTEVKQNHIRFKNLLRKAEDMIEALNFSTEDFLQPVRQLVDDHMFWSTQGDGLAVFLADGLFLTYRLPDSFEELVVVNDYFHIKPLFGLLTNERKYYVLAISQKRARLIRCTRQSCEEVTPDDLPQGIAEALPYDDPESQLQYHTGTQGPGKRPALFHGHGVGTDESKDNILRYFQQIDRALKPALQGEKAPLILAGVGYLHSLYRQANAYPHLLEEGLEMNPDEKKNEELCPSGWKIVAPYLKEDEKKNAKKYQKLIGTGLASPDLKSIIQAAVQGRVESLFVALDTEKWGKYNETENRLDIHREKAPGDRDLLDFAALHTFKKGGAVYVYSEEQLPDEGPICAVFRY